MAFQIIIPDGCFQQKLPRITNQTLLEISALLFFLFVIAEIIGAYSSDSLSLLGDAASMVVDVCTYICNIYAEWCKERFGRLSIGSRAIIEVLVPGLSVLALFIVTAYISLDALHVLYNPPPYDDVDVAYLYGYASANLLIDAICAGLFCLKADDVFVEAAAVPQLSLDTAISLHGDSDEDDDNHGDDEGEETDFIGNRNSNNSRNSSRSSGSNGRANGSSKKKSGGTAGSGVIDFRSTLQRGGSDASCDSDRSNNREHRQQHHGDGCWGQLRTLWGSFCSSTGVCCSSAAKSNHPPLDTAAMTAAAAGDVETADTDFSLAHSHSHSHSHSHNHSNQQEEEQEEQEHVHHNRKNLNMMSAFTHVLGDLLRTLAMFAAAAVSSMTGIDGDLCDATAALVVAATILLLCGSLVGDIAAAAVEIWTEEYGSSDAPILSKSRNWQRRLRLYGSNSKLFATATAATDIAADTSSSDVNCSNSNGGFQQQQHHSHQHCAAPISSSTVANSSKSSSSNRAATASRGEYTRLSDEEI